MKFYANICIMLVIFSYTSVSITMIQDIRIDSYTLFLSLRESLALGKYQQRQMSQQEHFIDYKEERF